MSYFDIHFANNICVAVVFRTHVPQKPTACGLYTINPIVARACIQDTFARARALGLKAARPSARDDRVFCIQRAPPHI